MDKRLVLVDACSRCHQHQWCTRHQEERYLRFFRRTAEFLANQFERLLVRRPTAAQREYLADERVRLFGEDQRIDPSTLGAFEVYFNNVLIFTKHKSHRWPQLSQLHDAVSIGLESRQELIRFMQKKLTQVGSPSISQSESEDEGPRMEQVLLDIQSLQKLRSQQPRQNRSEGRAKLCRVQTSKDLRTYKLAKFNPTPLFNFGKEPAQVDYCRLKEACTLPGTQRTSLAKLVRGQARQCHGDSLHSPQQLQLVKQELGLAYFQKFKALGRSSRNYILRFLKSRKLAHNAQWVEEEKNNYVQPKPSQNGKLEQLIDSYLDCRLQSRESSLKVERVKGRRETKLSSRPSGQLANLQEFPQKRSSGLREQLKTQILKNRSTFKPRFQYEKLGHQTVKLEMREPAHFDSPDSDSLRKSLKSETISEKPDIDEPAPKPQQPQYKQEQLFDQQKQNQVEDVFPLKESLGLVNSSFKSSASELRQAKGATSDGQEESTAQQAVQSVVQKEPIAKGRVSYALPNNDPHVESDRSLGLQIKLPATYYSAAQSDYELTQRHDQRGSQEKQTCKDNASAQEMVEEGVNTSDFVIQPYIPCKQTLPSLQLREASLTALFANIPHQPKLYQSSVSFVPNQIKQVQRAEVSANLFCALQGAMLLGGLKRLFEGESCGSTRFWQYDEGWKLVSEEGSTWQQCLQKRYSQLAVSQIVSRLTGCCCFSLNCESKSSRILKLLKSRKQSCAELQAVQHFFCLPKAHSFQQQTERAESSNKVYKLIEGTQQKGQALVKLSLDGHEFWMQFDKFLGQFEQVIVANGHEKMWHAEVAVPELTQPHKSLFYFIVQFSEEAVTCFRFSLAGRDGLTLSVYHQLQRHKYELDVRARATSFTKKFSKGNYLFFIEGFKIRWNQEGMVVGETGLVSFQSSVRPQVKPGKWLECSAMGYQDLRELFLPMYEEGGQCSKSRSKAKTKSKARTAQRGGQKGRSESRLRSKKRGSRVRKYEFDSNEEEESQRLVKETPITKIIRNFKDEF